MRKALSAALVAATLTLAVQPSYARGPHGGAIAGALLGGAVLGAVVGSGWGRGPAVVYSSPAPVYYAPPPPPPVYYPAPVAYDYYGRPVYPQRAYYYGPPPPPPY
ncbi:hypothetical protein [Chitinasiproducens palmae]|uniref:PXPV repeat-containing protein n=1 Tax=Chitinasiproducens palmae TaxID=1770053 RepID=A0A1H2PUK3_9BURK|nr:hypothetical protein [Chitinasiproducens palmae]SDV50058.1 hypothetical protein SAMN05216551_11084 [Chitinasiproducens palmae]